MTFSLLTCTALLSFLLIHIRDYPLTASGLSFFLVRTMMDAKIDKIVVFEDRFVVTTHRLLPFMTKNRVVLFSAVDSICAAPAQKDNYLLVRYKAGNDQLLSPAIYPAAFKKALDIIGNTTHIFIARQEVAA